jgi:WD40 repeat protein
MADDARSHRPQEVVVSDRTRAVALTAAIVVAVAAAPPHEAPPPRPAVRLDADGDPLPPGAVARLGTGRFRVGAQHPAALTPDGRFLLAGRGVLDLTTGHDVGRVPDALADGAAVEVTRASADGRAVVLRLTRRDGAEVRRSFAVWDIPARAVTREIAADVERLPGAFAAEHGLSPDGEQVAVGPGGRGLVVRHNGRSGGNYLVLWPDAAGPGPVVLGDSVARAWLGVAAEFTPDGRAVAEAGLSVRMWDAATGELLRQFPGPGDVVIRMALAPDGRHAAFVSGKATREEQARHETTYRVSLWDLEAGKEVREFTPRLTAREYGSGSQFPLRFSPDGSTVALLDHDRATQTMIVRHWRVADGRAGKAWPVPWAVGMQSPLLVGPGGKTVHLVSQHGVRTYDLATGEDRSPPGLRTGWHPVGLTADGRQVITADGREVTYAGGSPDRVLGFWDRETGRLVREEPLPAAITEKAYQTAYSPGARLVAVYRHTGPRGDRDTTVYDRATGRELYRLRWERDPAFGPDGGRLFTLPAMEYGSSNVWDAATGRPLRTVPFGGGDPRFFFSPDGREFGRPMLLDTRVFDAATGRVLAEGRDFLGGHFKPWQQAGVPFAEIRGPCDDFLGCAIGPGGRRLALAGQRYVDGRNPAGRVLVFDTAAKRLLWEANPAGPGGVGRFHPVVAAFSPDGSLLAVGGRRGVVLLDAETGKEARRLDGHVGHVQYLRFTPDGNRLIAADGDGTTWVWDAAR